MNCGEAQERVLDGLDSRVEALSEDVERHLAGCPECAAFARIQFELDARLSEAIAPSPQLAPGFTARLRERRTPATRLIPVWLPEAAHFGGWAAAIALCARLLPFAPETVLGAGAALAAGTYFLQILVAGIFEEAEDVAG